MTRQYYLGGKEIVNLYSELEKYAQVPSARTAAERSKNIRKWAIENGVSKRDAQSIENFAKNYINEQAQKYSRPAQWYIDMMANEPEEIETPEWMQDIDMPSNEEIELSIAELTRNSLIRLLEGDIQQRYMNEHLVLKLTLEIKHYEDSFEWVENKEKYIPIVDSTTITELLNSLKSGLIEDDTNPTGSDPMITKLPSLKLIKKFELKNLKEDNILVEQNWRSRRGHFFAYLFNTTNEQITTELKRCQIFHKITYKENILLKDTCIIYALREAGVSEDILINISNRFVNNYVQAVQLRDLFKEFNLKGRIFEPLANGKTRTIVNTGNEFSIVLFKNHYFLVFDTHMTKDWVCEAIKNPKTTIKPNYRIHRNRWEKADDRTINSLELVKLLFELDNFRDMKYSDLNGLIYEEKQKTPIYNLEYSKDACTKQLSDEGIKFKGIQPTVNLLYFADFETDPTNKHIPFMCCVSTYNTKEMRTYCGKNCGKQLLDAMPDGATIYFHNASFDINFIMPYVSNANVIRKGLRTISATITYEQKNIIIRDFFTLISMPLAKLPTFFHLTEDIKKEKFPYKYYTVKRFMRGIGEINKAYLKEQPAWSEEDIKQFKDNINSIPECKIDNNYFNMKKYCEFYCRQDVVVLRESFRKCRQLMNESFDIDIIYFLTTPAIANYCLERDVLRKAGIYYYGGKVKDYLSKAVYGGRCMCAWNRKWHTKVNIYDLDVCSLYPSAMARMFIPKGIPKVLTTEQCNDKQFLKSTDFYVATVHITKITKHRAMPLIPQKTKTGIEWNDYLPEGGLTQEFSSIFLEDLEKYYPGIEYTIERGYYWNEGKDYSIQRFIKNIYRKRGLYKLIKEPINEMYKLIMNSSYGKTIQKFIKTTTKIISAEKINEYVIKHKQQILNYQMIEGGKAYVVEMKKEIDKQFTPEHVGIIVLDMSKRIMNEVICLAEDIGCRIYYQDTDSIHIECDAVPKLAKAYEKIYNRPMLKKSIKLDKKYTIDDFKELEEKYGDLVEQEMGKFHDDFSSNKGDVECACESIFIRKKMYIDKLKIKNGEFDFQYRMKGIPQQCIKLEANNKYMELYEKIYNEENVNFNLLSAKVHFKQSRDYTISTVDKFTRTAASVYKEGNVEKYFEYGSN